MESDVINVLHDIFNETVIFVTSMAHILINTSFDGIQVCNQIGGHISTITWQVYLLLSNLIPDLIHIFWISVTLFTEISWEIFTVLVSILHIGIGSISNYISIEFLLKFLTTGVVKVTQLMQYIFAMGFNGLNVTLALLLAAQLGARSILLVFQKLLGLLFYQCFYAFRVLFFISLVFLLIACLVLFILHSKFKLRFPQRVAGMLVKRLLHACFAMFRRCLTSLTIQARLYFQSVSIRVSSESQYQLQINGTSSNSYSGAIDQRTTPELQTDRITSNSERRNTHNSSGYNLANNENMINQLRLELEHEKDKSRCCICQDSIKDTILMPCRHFCVCNDCWGDVVRASGLSTCCPLCRKSVTNSIKIFN